jgi:hypothetical protein
MDEILTAFSCLVSHPAKIGIKKDLSLRLNLHQLNLLKG